MHPCRRDQPCVFKNGGQVASIYGSVQEGRLCFRDLESETQHIVLPRILIDRAEVENENFQGFVPRILGVEFCDVLRCKRRQDHGFESPEFIRRTPIPDPELTWILSLNQR